MPDLLPCAVRARLLSAELDAVSCLAMTIFVKEDSLRL
jgi:hypothetical protein